MRSAIDAGERGGERARPQPRHERRQYHAHGRGGKLYEQMKKAEGGRSDRQFGVDIMSTPKTAQVVAEQYGVDEKTVRRDAAYAAAVDTKKAGREPGFLLS